MSIHVLRRAATITDRLAIGDYPCALQATLCFEAYGDMPVQGLGFRFHAPDGSLLHEISPLQGASFRHPLLSRVRKLPLALRLEQLLRQRVFRRIPFIVDLPSSCLDHPYLSVSVTNVSDAPIAVGNLRLRSSALAPNRVVQNQHAIEGYGDRISVLPGEQLTLFVHAPRRRFALTVLRHGAGERALLHMGGLEGKPQHYRANAYEQGAQWEPSLTVPVGADWPGGMYSARLSDDSGCAFDITFIIRKARQRAAAGLAVLASTNTWLAYNDWGGASLYRYDIPDDLGKIEGTLVHMQRPNPGASLIDGAGHLAAGEQHILRWLEQAGIAYDLYADIDLHQDPALLGQYHTLLISTHNEYWTDEMYSGLENFMEAGGNLVYLSGNGLYWKGEIRGQQMEVRRDGSSHRFSGTAGGRRRDCGRLEAAMLGVRFTSSGATSRYAPYRVITPGHWIFEGTGVEKGSLIGASGLNKGGASGWELDKIDRRNEPAGLVHLAKGTNPWRSGADMVYFTHPGGGGVFSVGSITFGGSLAVDPVLGRMVRNVIARFAQSAEARHATPGTARARAGRHRLDLPQS